MALVPTSVGDVLAMAASLFLSAASGPAYVVHGAVTSCSCGLRQSRVVVPLSHGCFIHDIAQLVVMDNKPYINIQTFGGCTSPENPSVQAAAAKIVKEVNSRPKGLGEQILDVFCDSSDEAADDSFVSQCAGACTPIILAPWDHGKSKVRLDGFKPLLFTDTLTCIYGGVIKLDTTGQPE